MCKNITWETETDPINIYYNGADIYCCGKHKDHFHDDKEELSKEQREDLSCTGGSRDRTN